MNHSKSLLNLQSRYSPRWPDKQTRRFIETRIKYEPFFDDRLYSTQEVWEKISVDAGIPEHWRKLRKKWSNLKYTYKKIYFRSNQTGNSPNTWPFFEILDKYENEIQAKTGIRNSPNFKIGELNEDSNSEDYFMETTNYIIEEPPNEIRTYQRVTSSQNTKSAELNEPLLRIDQSIFKPEVLNINPDPDSLVLKIEDESETEVYEIIPSPKQDYPSDPVEYETYDEVNDVITASQLSQQPGSPVPNDEEVCSTAKPHENQSNNAVSEKSNNKSKKRKCFKLDDETRHEKKLRREILKCTNVFLKYMKSKYDIDPDPISSESDSEFLLTLDL